MRVIMAKVKKPKQTLMSTLHDRHQYTLRVLNQCDVMPTVLIMDPVSAANFINLRDRTRDILLFDEPTASMTDLVKIQHGHLMTRLASITVFMSATLESLMDMKKACQDISFSDVTWRISGLKWNRSVYRRHVQFSIAHMQCGPLIGSGDFQAGMILWH